MLEVPHCNFLDLHSLVWRIRLNTERYSHKPLQIKYLYEADWYILLCSWRALLTLRLYMITSSSVELLSWTVYRSYRVQFWERCLKIPKAFHTFRPEMSSAQQQRCSSGLVSWNDFYSAGFRKRHVFEKYILDRMVHPQWSQLRPPKPWKSFYALTSIVSFTLGLAEQMLQSRNSL